MALSREPALDVSALTGVRVLVVEDAWHVAKAMKGALEQLGMHVIGPTATTAEARRLTAAEKPRLALVDVNLKKEMACDLIDELHGQGIPVVVVSGYASISGCEGEASRPPAKTIQCNRIDGDASCSCSSAPLRAMCGRALSLSQVEGIFEFAPDAARREHIVDGAAELVGNEIADYGRPISGCCLRSRPVVRPSPPTQAIATDARFHSPPRASAPRRDRKSSKVHRTSLRWWPTREEPLPASEPLRQPREARGRL